MWADLPSGRIHRMDVFDAIKHRRSVREFRRDPVPPEDVETILNAGRYAPSAGNGQPWRFLVVRNSENLARLREAVCAAMVQRIDASDKLTEDRKPDAVETYRKYIGQIFAAPVLVFVFVDTSEHPDLVGYDGALAVQNMMLAAHALGYGTCYQTTLFSEDVVRCQFDVPRHYRFLCAVPIGVASSAPQPPERRPLDELVWEERFPK
jgi:nitroreductase